eukprot:gene19351-14413_t
MTCHGDAHMWNQEVEDTSKCSNGETTCDRCTINKRTAQCNTADRYATFTMRRKFKVYADGTKQFEEMAGPSIGVSCVQVSNDQTGATWKWDNIENFNQMQQRNKLYAAKKHALRKEVGKAKDQGHRNNYENHRLYVEAAAGGIDTSTPRRSFGWDTSLEPIAPNYRSRRQASISVPSDFDSRQHWPFCDSIRQIHDQGQCGSCWSFGSTTAFTDRWCIASNQTSNPELSVETTLTCSMSDGCGGGSNANAWDFFYTNGVPGDECRPYTPAACPGSSYGQNPCWGPPLPGSPTTHPTPQCLHYTPGPTDEDIMADMQTHGPQATCFKVYDDFLRYTGGVYTLTEGSPYIGGHCVRLLGWGVSLETEASSTGANKAVEKSYWLAANEWGT